MFLIAFGDSPVLRILDFFMVYEDLDYSMKQIAKNAGVGYSTLKMFWPTLVETGIMAHTRDVGNAKLYTLNLSSPAVKKFKKFYWEFTKQEAHKDLEKKGMVKKVVVKVR